MKLGHQLAQAKSAVRMLPGGAFSTVIPNDPEVTARRNEALRMMEDEARAERERIQGELPHRSKRRGSSLCHEERRRQELSLGRAPLARIVGGEEIHLHPLTWDQYLFQLALLLPELAGRLEAMRAEMLARPEEYAGRVFDLNLWAAYAMPPEDPRAALEEALAEWVQWIAIGGACDVLCYLGMLKPRSRWIIANWICHHYHPALPEDS